jgi:hypothetical protein
MLSFNNNNAYDHIGRERQVIELYNQGKSTRDIAKELRMSLRDISIILKKHGVNHGIASIDDIDDNNKKSHSNNEKATQAYKLFSEGKKPFEVAIELGIREAQVNKFFREFWKLKRLNQLYEIYPQIRCYLPSFLNLHKVLKRKGLTTANVEWFANAIETAAIKIPDLQKQYAKLQDEVQVIDHQKVVSKAELHNMNNQVSILRRTMYQLSSTCNSKRNEISYLQNQIQVLEGYVNGFNGGNQQKKIDAE